MKNFTKLSLITVATIALAGCAGLGSNEGSGTAGASHNNVHSYALGSQHKTFGGQNIASGFTGDAQQRAEVEKLPTTIYFAFAKYNLNHRTQKQVSKNAAFLLKNPGQFAMLAGNTDPRGSQEYNFHLGQRRANAVKSDLLAQGVSPSQLCTVSYGELRPAVTPKQLQGNWRKAYQIDRRTEIVYGARCEGATKHG